jgi:nitrogen fixation protein FixH
MSSNVHLAFFTLLIMGVVALLTYLAVRSGSGYSVSDTKAHAEKFPDNIEEGHGGMTAFTWITFGSIFVWCIVYLVLNWSKFASVFFKH